MQQTTPATQQQQLQPIQLELLVLGVGKGASCVYENKTSSCMIIREKHSQTNILLVDIGLGAMHSLQKYTKQTVSTIFVTHNHTDHSGELPVVIAVETCQKHMLKILAQTQVMQRLQDYRCAENWSSTVYASTYVPYVQWIPCETSTRVPISFTIPTNMQERTIYLQVVQSQHSELCYGFVLYESLDAEEPFFAYSGDSGFNNTLYAKLWQANIVFVDARKTGDMEHAGFEQVFAYHKQHAKHEQQQVFIYHYGNDTVPTHDSSSNIQAAQIGQVIRIL